VNVHELLEVQHWGSAKGELFVPILIDPLQGSISLTFAPCRVADAQKSLSLRFRGFIPAIKSRSFAAEGGSILFSRKWVNFTFLPTALPRKANVSLKSLMPQT
jgi:hypothetical protein